MQRAQQTVACQIQSCMNISLVVYGTVHIESWYRQDVPEAQSQAASANPTLAFPTSKTVWKRDMNTSPKIHRGPATQGWHQQGLSHKQQQRAGSSLSKHLAWSASEPPCPCIAGETCKNAQKRQGLIRQAASPAGFGMSSPMKPEMHSSCPLALTCADNWT